MRRQRAEAQRALVLRHEPEPPNPAEAEERRRREQPLVDEDADERAAGDDGRVRPLGLQRERLLERRRSEPLRFVQLP